MRHKIIEALKLFNCTHQFSWPRRQDNGEYYQVCLACGAEYEYDWASMRRTEQRRHHQPHGHRSDAPLVARARSHRSWRPRERRVRYDIPLQYRVYGTKDWLDGTVENISRSGVLFRCQQSLDMGQQVEMIFEMPAEISGQPGSRVLCSGALARVTLPTAAEDRVRMAATIDGYHFLPQQPPSEIKDW